MEIKTGIYKITNLINNKSYIGQSKNIYHRWQRHKQTAYNPNMNGYNYPLYQAIRQYGLENFSFEIIEECPNSLLNEKELYYMLQFNSLKNGYNQVLPSQRGTDLIPSVVFQIIEELKSNKKENTEAIGKKFNVSGKTIRDINAGRSWKLDNIKYPIRPLYVSQNQEGSIQYFCIDCGKLLKTKAKRCVECAHLAQRIATRPSRNELKNLIRTTSFLQIGKQFNVSDNAIRKWCKEEHLPYRKKDINSYSDDEWNLV